VLDNADGTLTGAAGAALGLFAGASLELRPGYVTSLGTPEYGAFHEFTIDALATAWDGGAIGSAARRVTIARCSGAWEAARRFLFPQTWQTAAALRTRSELAARAAARAGWRFVSGSGAEAPSTNFTTHQPSFVFVAGESVANILDRLLAPMSDGLRSDEGRFAAIGIGAADATDYAYGLAHPILKAELADTLPTHNWAVVTNPNVRYAQEIDEYSVYQHGALRSFVRSLDASSNTRATDYATAHARRGTWARELGEVTVPVNAGAQLFDVIELTVPQLGLAAAKYRVIGIALTHRRDGTTAEYTHRLTLGGL
jgi:hypothetical protein